MQEMYYRMQNNNDYESKKQINSKHGIQSVFHTGGSVLSFSNNNGINDLGGW